MKDENVIKDKIHIRYIGVVIDYDKKNMTKKIVIDIPKNFETSAVIVTLY